MPSHLQRGAAMHDMGFCVCPECPQNRNRRAAIAHAAQRIRRRELLCECEWCDLWERFRPDIDLGDIAQAYDLVHRFFRGASIPAIRVQRTIRDLARDIVAFTRLSEYVVDPRITSFVDRLNELRDDVRFENLAMRRKALRGVERRECILGW